MAWRRNVSTTETFVSRLFHPSFAHILHDNNEDAKPHSSTSSSSPPVITNIFPSGSYNSTVGFSCGPRCRGRTGSSLAPQTGWLLSFTWLAIKNMAEKVPSFQSGGAYWFIDLTTPDSFPILPILTALTFLITVECNMREGLEGNPLALPLKTHFRISAALLAAVLMVLPKAMYCYLITSNLFSIAYGSIIMRPGVKSLLRLPEITVPPSGASKLK